MQTFPILQYFPSQEQFKLLCTAFQQVCFGHCRRAIRVRYQEHFSAATCYFADISWRVWLLTAQRVLSMYMTKCSKNHWITILASACPCFCEPSRAFCRPDYIQCTPVARSFLRETFRCSKSDSRGPTFVGKKQSQSPSLQEQILGRRPSRI